MSIKEALSRFAAWWQDDTDGWPTLILVVAMLAFFGSVLT